MSHDLSLAQNHAFDLSRPLMVPVTLFEVDGDFLVLPSDTLAKFQLRVLPYCPRRCILEQAN